MIQSYDLASRIVLKLSKMKQWILLILCLFLSGDQCTSIKSVSDRLLYEKSLKLNPNQLSPVILVPGLGGNTMEAKLNKINKPHIWCCKHSAYFRIWLNLIHFAPLSIDCWIDNIRLNYDNVTRANKNTAGVKIRVAKMGNTQSVEWLYSTPIIDLLDTVGYFHYIIEALTQYGYVRDRSVFGAPYDFRKGPNENKQWFKLLKKLTENAYKANGNIGITFLTHSMGGRMILYFLQQLSPSWKDKYVKQVISLATPWGGSVEALQALSVGRSIGHLIKINRHKMWEVMHTFSSLVWLLPSSFFWKPTDIIAIINKKKYTAQTLHQFFRDIGSETIVEMRKDLLGYDNFTAPGVQMHCLFSSMGKQSVKRLDFGTHFNENPKLIRGLGDGTVNWRSLDACNYWMNDPAQRNRPIHQKMFSGVSHHNILNDMDVVKYIINVLTGHSGDELKIRKSVKNVMEIRLF